MLASTNSCRRSAQGAIGIEARDGRHRDARAAGAHRSRRHVDRARLPSAPSSPCSTARARRRSPAMRRSSGDALQFPRPDRAARRQRRARHRRRPAALADAATIGADAGRALRQYAGPGFFDYHARRGHPPASRRRAHRRRARARGHEVLLAPLMRVEPIAADLAGAWSGVIVTSANAPGALDDAAKVALLGLPVYAVRNRSRPLCGRSKRVRMTFSPSPSLRTTFFAQLDGPSRVTKPLVARRASWTSFALTSRH